MDANIELSTITSMLDLEEFEVVASSWDRQSKLRTLTLVPVISVGLCPHCHQASMRRHGCHERVVLDLPMGKQRVELVVRIWQFACVACNRFFTPRFAALAEGAHATERLLERLAELARHGDLSNAARFFAIPEKTAEDWYYAYLERRRKHPTPHLEPVRSLGIDELSLKKDIGPSAKLGAGSSAAC